MRTQKAIKLGVLVLTEVICAAAALYAARLIIIKCILYWYGLRGPDSTLYFTMGNAIRHGLTVYRDIFDPKPPGIFLLSAGSLSLFNDGTLAEMLNILILLCIPVIFVAVGLSYMKLFGRWKWGIACNAPTVLLNIVLLQFSLIVGLIFALYHATIGGDIQTEFYGAFFGIVYLVCVDVCMRKSGGSRTAPTTIALIIACLSAAICLLFKEPFALTLFASALLLLRTRREWIRFWLIPMITAGVTYVIVLASLGALGSYITIYLRAMLGNYIFAGGPVWARGLVAWERMYINVLDFSAWFPLLIIAMFILSLPVFSGKRGKLAGVAFTAVCIFTIMTVRSLFPEHFPWWQLWVGTAGMLLAISLGAFVSGIWHGGLAPFLRRTWRHGLALYLTLTAIALGSGFHGQYFALALPVYFAFFILILRRQNGPDPYSSNTLLAITALASAILLTSTSFIHPSMTLAQMTEQINTHDNDQRGAAKRLDAILDACDIDRYYFLEAEPLPYAKHSPLNFYLYTRIEHIGRFHPLFFDETFRRLGQSQIIIEAQPYVPSPRKGNVEEECIGESVQKFVATQFSEKMRACAKGIPAPEGYQILFRKNQDNHTEPDVLNCKLL